MKQHQLSFSDGIKDGIPICMGYFPIAMTFGILSKGALLTFMETIAFSFIVFAGASQFIAVSMIAAGAGGFEIILMTLFLNFRHFLMSASIATKIEKIKPLLKPLIAFQMTDESFSVASFSKGNLSEKYMIAMQNIAYLGWGSGTAVGFLIGSVLPDLLQKSMQIGLYAMFVALLMPEIKKSSKALVLAGLSGILNAGMQKMFHLQQGWSIVISIVVVSTLGVILYKNELLEENKVMDEHVTHGVISDGVIVKEGYGEDVRVNE